MARRPPLTFDESVPERVRRIARRWVKRLNLHEWSIKFFITPADALYHGDHYETEAIAVLDKPKVSATRATMPQYLKADIWISDEVGKDEMEDVIIHELLHLPFSWLEHVVCQAWDGRRRMSRDDALLLLNDKIEELIERHLKIL